MNYRHAFHAGNFADVLKHAVLARVLLHLQAKEPPFRVIDTHAGVGRYDLMGDEASRTGEWQHGIGRLLGADLRVLASQPEALWLAPLLDAVIAENAAGGLRYYPGSPIVARRLLRRQDRLVVVEKHPQDAALLAEHFRGDQNVKVHELDGWQAAKAFLPPKERRGVVLIDPPYEEAGELDRVVEALAGGYARFAGGTFIAWYPVKAVAPVEQFCRAVAATGIRKVLRVELHVHRQLTADRLNGCGLIIVNPPWKLPGELAIHLPWLARQLAVTGEATCRLDWLADELGGTSSLRG